MDLQCDILCVQETHFLTTAAPVCKHRHFNQVFSAPFTSKQRGVLIAVKDSTSFQLKKSVLDPEGRYIILICTINNVMFTLINVYAPNVHQMRFFRKLMAII